jgi:hypothetical protein
MDEVVELELIKLAGIQPSETFAHVLEESSQLTLVIGRDDVPGLVAGGLVTCGPVPSRPCRP